MNAFVGPADPFRITPGCFEEQARYVGMDNTGTIFSDTATYCIETDGGNGPTVEFTQLPEGGWTAQFQNQWVPNVTAAAEALGLKWIVEAAFVNNSDLADLSGIDTIPGVLTESIAQQFADNGMSWRFLQITVCPGSPTPTRFWRKESERFDDPEEGKNLLITPTQLGPFREFRICEVCEKDGIEQQFYLRNDTPPAGTALPYTWDLLDPATQKAQIPKCLVPCGTIAVAPAPTNPTCQFQTQEGADNGVVIGQDADGADICQPIIRRYEYCAGETTSEFLQEVDNGDGTTDFIPYMPLVGEFVDRDTKEPIDEPVPPCSDTRYNGNIWRLKGAPTPGTKIEWWAPSTFPAGSNAATHDNASNIFSNDGTTLTHANGAPDVVFNDTVFSVEGTNTPTFLAQVGAASTAETSGTDQLKLSGYVVLTSPARLRDGGTRTGERGGIWINKCCAGDLELLEERTNDTVSGDTGVFNRTLVPAGIHYLEIATSDLSAWHNMTLQASFDDGATYGPFVGYRSKPQYECVPTYRCVDTGVCVYKDGTRVIEDQFTQWHEPKGCTESPGESTDTGSGAYEGPTADEIAAATVAAERDVTPAVFTWVNEGDTVSLPVPAGTRGRIVSIEDFGTGFVRWSIDGSDPVGSTAPEFTTTGPYHAAYALRNVDLSQVRLNGSSTNSDYSIAYEVYN